MKLYLNLAVKCTLYGALSFFIYLMVLITLQYVPIDFNAAFLAIKSEEIKLLHYQIAFFTHVYTSIFVLILGFFQFSRHIRRSYTSLHRNFGKAYIGLILFFAAPSGLIMGYYGNGGFYSQVSFVLLAMCWFYFTWMAYLKIKQRNFQAHERFMILSYALTLSAISLRLFKWLIANTLALPPMDIYKIVVWLGWLFNLGVAMVIIQFKNKPS
jgi:Predicted membrane protein (DUF2306)